MPQPATPPAAVTTPPGQAKRAAVVVNHPGSVVIDGTSVGSLFDAVHNYRDNLVELQDGFNAWVAAQAQAVAEAEAARADDHKKAKDKLAADFQLVDNDRAKQHEASAAQLAADYQRKLDELGAAYSAELLTLQTTVREQIAAAQAAAAQAIDEARTRARDDVVTRVAAVVATAEAERKRQVDARDATIADLEKQVAALGTTEQARAIMREQRIEQLKRQRADAEAELARMGGAAAPAVEPSPEAAPGEGPAVPPPEGVEPAPQTFTRTATVEGLDLPGANEG